MPSAEPRELFLIDGNSLAYRAFFALPETIATSRGMPTNAIFGFASMLVKILTEYGPKATLVGLGAACDYLDALTREKIAAHDGELGSARAAVQHGLSIAAAAIDTGAAAQLLQSWVKLSQQLRAGR